MQADQAARGMLDSLRRSLGSHIVKVSGGSARRNTTATGSRVQGWCASPAAFLGRQVREALSPSETPTVSELLVPALRSLCFRGGRGWGAALGVLKANVAHCLHCRTCVVKDPLDVREGDGVQNIVWRAPSEGGPRYEGL
ncbi:4Fe-4S dicluster domain-containing protein [Nitrospira sp. Kam-Ns4a]